MNQAWRISLKGKLKQKQQQKEYMLIKLWFGSSVYIYIHYPHSTDVEIHAERNHRPPTLPNGLCASWGLDLFCYFSFCACFWFSQDFAHCRCSIGISGRNSLKLGKETPSSGWQLSMALISRPTHSLSPVPLWRIQPTHLYTAALRKSVANACHWWPIISAMRASTTVLKAASQLTGVIGLCCTGLDADDSYPSVIFS